MTEKQNTVTILCGGGLDVTENHLALAEKMPGAASRLVNFEPSLYGGYRRINGYEAYDALNPTVGDNTAEGAVLGVLMYHDLTTGAVYPIAARKDTSGNTYSFWKHTAGVGWSKMTTGTTQATVDGSRTISQVNGLMFNFGAGNLAAFVDGINKPLLFDGTDWYELNNTGTTAGTDADPGGDQLLSKPSRVTVFENHLFFGGEYLKEGLIAHSAPNNPYNWTTAGGSGQITLGFNFVNFKPFRDNLYVFGENTIKRIQADASAGFTLKTVTTNVGCIAADSLVEVGGDLLFLAPDGLRPVAGTARIGDVELNTVSRAIQPLTETYPTLYDLDDLRAVVLRKKGQVRYFLSGSSTERNGARGLVCALRFGDEGTRWEFGELEGIRASCTESAFINRVEYVLHGDYNGTLYRQERGYSFDGADITAVFETPYYSIGDSQVRKTPHKLHTHFKSEGAATVYVNLKFDYKSGDSRAPDQYEVDVPASAAEYGRIGTSYNMPGLLYGGESVPYITTNTQGSHFAMQIRYFNRGTDPSFTIQGFVLELDANGRV